MDKKENKIMEKILTDNRKVKSIKKEILEEEYKRRVTEWKKK